MRPIQFDTATLAAIQALAAKLAQSTGQPAPKFGK